MPCTRNMTHDPEKLLKVEKIKIIFKKKPTRIAKKEKEEAIHVKGFRTSNVFLRTFFGVFMAIYCNKNQGSDS